MNGTISQGANFILVVLGIFSILGLGTFLYLIKEMQKAKSNLKRATGVSSQREEEDFDLEVANIEMALDWFPSFASIAMLLGLLGTVLGIYTSFSEMQAAGKATMDVLAGGIKDALLTTIVGLLVAIPFQIYSQILESLFFKLKESHIRSKKS
ncbi:transporter, MotA/TolQ/ExbB proton channel family protein [Leptospira ryugenii]|uniref:Transporter, MotA/TolQ/ExbB proton channel family protein n=1 Tax=Leptospira ryugenii TaxID=1917863 RepID=A0A2P2E560_9LEPT|nr:MotA/TolQ/ExbB proton channel family protein [Leptospira ryugenii]GBF52009.1 transporter, MotA/TolQ/ExbB proton channel family protein [Leptospira ryugenii]